MGHSEQLSIVLNTVSEYFMDQQKSVNIKDLMKYEWMRFASFAKFPFDSPVHSTRLAEAGFYYQDHEDEVICFSCGVKHKGWALGDIPLDIHKSLSSNCPFLNGNGEENIAIRQSPWKVNEQNGENLSATGNTSERETNIPVVANQSVTTSGNFVQQTTGACGGPLDTPNTTAEKSPFIRNGYITANTNDVKYENVIGGQNANQESSYVSSENAGTSRPESNRGTPAGSEHAANPRLGQERISSNNRSANRTLQFVSSTSANNNSNEASRNHSVDFHHTNSQNGNQTIARFQLEPLGISFERPAYPQFAILATRLSSFKNWPKHVKQRPEELSKSGLFHEGTDDRVRCFFCGGGLCNWDPDDDPWIEHARWYPRCVFLRQSKGDEFIYQIQEEVQKGNENLSHLKETLNGSTQNEVTHRNPTFPDEDIFLSHPASLSVLDMGVNPELVKKAMHLLSANKGRVNITAEQLLEKVWEIEDQAAAANSEDQHNHMTNGTLDLNGRENNAASGISSGNTKQTTTKNVKQNADQSAERRKDDAERIAIMEENRHLRELQICKICLDEDVSIVFLPCGHMATCASCAPALRKCPICRTFIKGTVKAIIS